MIAHLKRNFLSVLAASCEDRPDGFDGAVADADEAVPAVDQNVLLGTEESGVLFTQIAERYVRRSLGITSDLVFSEWERVFDNPMAAVGG